MCFFPFLHCLFFAIIRGQPVPFLVIYFPNFLDSSSSEMNRGTHFSAFLCGTRQTDKNINHLILDFHGKANPIMGYLAPISQRNGIFQKLLQRASVCLLILQTPPLLACIYYEVKESFYTKHFASELAGFRDLSC